MTTAGDPLLAGMLPGLVFAAIGLALLLAAPALARLHAFLLAVQLGWVRGPGGRWLWRLIGALVLVAGLATAFFASQR